MIPPYVTPIRSPLRRQRRALQLRQQSVLISTRLTRLKQQTLYTRNQTAQRRYLPGYLKGVLMHFRASMLHSLRR